MKIQGGGLSFEISGSNDKLLSILDESKRAIQKFSTAAVSGGKGMDKAFEKAAAAIEKGFENIDRIIDTNKVALTKLQEEYKRLSSEAAKAFMEARDTEYRRYTEAAKGIQSEITLRKKLINEASATADQLRQEEETLNKQKEAAEKNAKVHMSLRTQLRNVREELALMEANGQRGTETFRKLQEEAGRLTDAIGDATTQARIFSHDNRGLQGMISGLSGVVGAFSAAQGAVALFAGENENLQKVMLKVQSLMSITMGLQQVADTINKDSAFMLTTVAKAKELLAAATNKLTIALGGSTIAAKALMATLTLGLSIAITAIIVAISKLQSKQAAAKKEAEEFNKKVAETAGKPVAAYRTLQTEWLSLSNSLKEREKWVQDNSDKFKDLGYSVRSAKEAEELLVNNSSKFVQAMMLRAKATATSELAVEKYKAVIEAQNKVDKTPETKLQKGGEYTDGYGVKRKTNATITVTNPEWVEAKKNLDNIEAEYDRLINKQIDFTKQEQNLLAQIGNQAGQIIAGSVEAAEKELSRLQEQYKKTGSDKERASLKKQIEAQQQEVNRISLSTGSTGKQSDPYLAMLTKRKEEYAKYLKWITSKDKTVRQAANTEFAALLKEGSSYLDYLENQRSSIESKTKKTATDLKNLSTLNSEIANATNETVISDFNTKLQRELSLCQTVSEQLALIEKRREELSGDNSDVDNTKSDILNAAEEDTKEKAEQDTKELLQKYARYLQEKLDFAESYARNRELLERRLSSASSEAEKKRTQVALEELEKRRKFYEKSSGNEQYDQLLLQYQSFEEQKTAIREKYAKLRTEAQTKGDGRMVGIIDRQEARELLESAFDNLKLSPDYVRAFDDLKSVSTTTLESLLVKFDEVKQQAAATLNPEDLREYMNTFQRLTDELNSRDPFTALKTAYKELNDAEDEVAAAERELDNIRSGGQSAITEAVAVERLNKARDKQLRASNKVKKAEADVLKTVKKLTSGLSELGSTIQGEAGEIISLIGDIGTFTLSAIEGFETASKASSKAIQTLEKASIILAIISAAYQMATKVISLFTGNDGTAEYERTRDIYKSYISILDDVIDKQLELVESLGSQGAKNASDYAISLLEKEGAAARQLGKDYLNAGASKGVLGIGSKASHGVAQRKNITSEAWAEYWGAIGKAGISQWEAQEAVAGRMTGMFDLTAEQLRILRNEAQLFWAQLDEDTREYLNAIIEVDEKTEEAGKKLQESYTGISFDSLKDDFLNMLYEWDTTAESISRNIGDYMRKALINNLFKEKYSAELKEWYEKWAEAMSDGKLTDDEQIALDKLRNSMATGMEQAISAINKQFEWVNDSDPSTLSGAIKGASQESIDLLAGQTNAVRVNQVTALGLMREQLLYLSNIDRGVNIVIPQKLQAIINKLPDSNDSGLRSQGII